MKRTFINNNNIDNIKTLLRINGISLTNWRKLKKEAIFFINNEKAMFYEKIKQNDTITIIYETNNNAIPQNKYIEVLYEDNFLLVINKPKGIYIHPNISQNIDTLANYLSYYITTKEDFDGIHFVSRLDKDTSGVVLIAKTANIKHLLSKIHIKKTYIAILSGYLPAFSGIIDLPILRSENSILEREINLTGKKALTYYKVLRKKKNNTSLVKFILQTGRTHQIRVHTSFLQAPIVGDFLYSSEEAPTGHLLHARSIAFIHPIFKTEIYIKSKVPFLKDTCIHKKN